MDRYKGYYRRSTQLKNKFSGQYETVYILKDGNKLIGIFDDDTFADRFWDNEYLPSKRTIVQENNTYIINEGDI